MSNQPPREPASRLLEFPPLAAWVRAAAGVVLAAALIATVVDGMLNGLSFAMMMRWMGAAVIALLLLVTVSAAVHALRGAGSAQRRGERLSSDDVGLMPPRRPRD